MQLDAAQNRIVRSKPLQTSLIRGVSGTGKTTAAVYRALFLKNNYCLYEDDRILILAKDSTDRDLIRHLYNQVEDETKYDFKTLLTNNVDRVEILTIEDIINRYYFEYTNNYKKWYKIIQDDSEKLAFINEAAREVRRKYGYIKLLEEKNINFFKDEIAFIKACRFTNVEVYQNADRVGRKCKSGEGPARLAKNSKSRQILFELYEGYNSRLEEQGVIDCEDITYIALKQIQEAKGNKFTHILVDGAENITKAQLDFVKKLNNERRYSTNTFVINKADITNYKAWFVKGRKIGNLDLGDKVKSCSLLKIYKESQEEIDIMQENVKGSVELYEYLDLKHRRRYEFKRDSDIRNELILDMDKEETTIKEGELRTLPVYSDIAAGEPIMISSEMEEEFYLPEYWLKGSRDCFILKVRGDSMIGANIFDGDFVVIKKQSVAQNSDIVAVDLDGSATLKRLSFKKGVALLMPENEKYEPIFMHDKEASIIGIAVGVIKNK